MVSLIKTLMSLKGINQVDIARETGISTTALSRFLNDTTELRSESLVKVLSFLGLNLDIQMKREINRALGAEEDISIGEDISYLLDQASPITRKTITDTLIASFKNDKNPDTKSRLMKLKKYRDSIRTVRRSAC